MICLGDAGELLPGQSSAFDKAMPLNYSRRRWSRKWWEWDYIADCAEQLGVLSPLTRAVGLGAGDEPLIFYFAQTCGHVIALDLYSPDTAWSEARFAATSQVLDASPIPYPRGRVEVLNADMRQTGIAEQSVDFVWSCSSIEHVPTLVDIFTVFKEMDRIVRIGGYAVLTTEYCITETTYLLPGVNAWNAPIFDLMTGSVPGWEIVGKVDLSFNALHPANAARPRRYPPSSVPTGHLGQIPHFLPSGTMARPVGLSVIVPIGLVLRKASGLGVVDWRQADVPERLRIFSDGLVEFFAGDNDAACHKLEAIYAEAVDDLQLRHLAFRFLIDARARRGEMRNSKAFADRLEQFLKHTPAGPVQDADCLDLCGYLLGECGRIELALITYERCLSSPSTSLDHVLKIAVRYMALAARNGRTARAIEWVSVVLADLMRFGGSDSEINQLVLKPISDQLPADIGADLQRAIAREGQSLSRQ
jgi:Methyltransferase domain